MIHPKNRNLFQNLCNLIDNGITWNIFFFFLSNPFDQKSIIISRRKERTTTPSKKHQLSHSSPARNHKSKRISHGSLPRSRRHLIPFQGYAPGSAAGSRNGGTEFVATDWTVIDSLVIEKAIVTIVKTRGRPRKLGHANSQTVRVV